MIGKFWDEIFEYCDSLREKLSDRKGDAVMDILQECHDLEDRSQVNQIEGVIKEIVLDVETKAKLAAAREIQRRLTTVWDDKEFLKQRIDKKAESDVEKLVLSIPGLEVYVDPQDKNVFYEMDGRHFDKPEEVIVALIDYRRKGRKEAMTQTKLDMLRYIHAQLKGISMADLDSHRKTEVTKKNRPKLCEDLEAGA